MKQLKNFLIKREQSQTRLSFAECEKSRLIAKLSLTLAALIMAAAGAWAQDADEVAVTKTANNNEWTLTMPDGNVELQVEYYAESNIFLSKEALADKASIAVTAGELGVQFGEDGKSANTVTEGTPVTVTYNGSKKVIGFKVEKKASTPTLKDALADGATVVITYTWSGTNVTTFTYTNNGGNYTGSTTGDDAEYFANGMTMDGTTLKFTASNPDFSEANVSIDFFTDTNEYLLANKGSSFTSFTISVNGTDVTSQLTAVK